jgi:hypothetical protein
MYAEQWLSKYECRTQTLLKVRCAQNVLQHNILLVVIRYITLSIYQQDK